MNDTDTSPAPAVEAVEFFWRPGCPFCSMLERDLVAAGIPLVKRNIWDDPTAAEFVRSVADGNETVPTVVIGEVGMVNPNAKQVAHHLEQFAPHLLPDDYQPAQPGLLGRLLGG